MIVGGAQTRVPIDTSLVEQLIAEQFPRWAHDSVVPVEEQGNDNRTFRLGDELSVRLPSAERYASHVGIEHEWLPRLSGQLPLPIPTPVGRGRPGCGYAWSWSVNRWLQGQPASLDRIGDLVTFADDLADFLGRLRSLDAAGAPSPGPHNFFRGGSLAAYDAETRTCIEALTSEIDAVRATGVWETALASSWSEPPVWFHGDVAPDNLLIESGKLCGVIDFGQLAAGDPACDVAIAWTLFSGDSRHAFRTRLAIDDATWARGRGWALWKALLHLHSAVKDGRLDETGSRRVLHEVLVDEG